MTQGSHPTMAGRECQMEDVLLGKGETWRSPAAGTVLGNGRRVSTFSTERQPSGEDWQKGRVGRLYVSKMPQGRQGQRIPPVLSSATPTCGIRFTDWVPLPLRTAVGVRDLSSFSLHPQHGSWRHFPFLYPLVALIL